MESEDEVKLVELKREKNSVDGNSVISEPHKLPKISGKAWGVLQFRKLRAFPFSVLFIVGNEFCERFSYYGMRAVLVLFFTNQLDFGENTATAVYHAFIVLCYLLPLLGAVLSDSYLGKYGTIFSLSVVHAIGNVLVSISAIPFDRIGNIVLVSIGLIVNALGTGGIKPCVSAFGGDQFKDGDHLLLRRFFSLFYFSINAGSFISILLTPVLRGYVNCFNTCECFALAFGVPAVLMIISLLIFLLGTRYYIINKPKKEASKLYFNVPASVVLAAYRRISGGRIPERKFLHYACPTYSEAFMEDVRMFLRVLVMLLPLPVFWALFDQQGSRWTLQGTRMNGHIVGDFVIQPDQIQALNPIFILIFIPFFEAIVYPIFAKCHLLKRPLQRMVAGMVLACLAFVVAGFVQLRVQTVQETLGPQDSKLVVYNTLPTPVECQLYTSQDNRPFMENHTLPFQEHKVLSKVDTGNYTLTFSLDSMSMSHSLTLQGHTVSEVYVIMKDGQPDVVQNDYEDFPPDGGHANLQVINLVQDEDLEEFQIVIEAEGGDGSTTECTQAQLETNLTFKDTNRTNLTVGKYDYIITRIENSSLLAEKPISFEQVFEGGAVYTVVIDKNANSTELNTTQERYGLHIIEVDPPNSVSIFLQVPMYVLITAGEVMFSITGLEFAYSQAPASMKAMCQAVWLLTAAVGNFVVVIVTESSLFENRALEFFFFAILIGAVTLLFAVMSFFYKYVDLTVPSEKEHEDDTTILISEDNEEDYVDKKRTSAESLPHDSESTEF